MRATLILGLLVLALCGCSEPTGCEYQHTDPARVAGRAWVPERDVYRCDGNVWIYKGK